MSVRFRFILGTLCFSTLLPLTTARAQRGQLIENLFRSIAEAQVEREQTKREEAEKRAQELKAVEKDSATKDPYRATLPSDFGTRRETPNLRPSATGPRTPQGRAENMSINVRSREAAQYAGNLVQFNQQMVPLLNELRGAASRNAAIRGLMPEAYAVAADGQALLRRCDGLSRLDPIIDPYRELDSRWRQLSFNLQNVSGLSNRCSAAIQECDRLCGLMAEQLRIEPQFDREALHDVMLTASVYMQAMIDDFEIAVSDRSECQRLSHDLQKLRQRLLNEAHRVHDVGYNELVSSFTNFGGDWRQFSREIYAIENAHLHRRLDRIGECGEQTYRLLRMTPPMSAEDLAEAAHRLHQGLESLFGQLTMRAMVRLQANEQIRVMQSFHNVYDQANRLEKLIVKSGDRSQARDSFVRIDRDWSGLQETLLSIAALNRGTIAEIARSCDQLRIGLGIAGANAPRASVTDLLQAAAALESTAEYLDASLKRYDRQLTPNSFRNSIRDAARELRHHSQDLYELLDGRGQLSDERYLRKLQGEAEHLLEGWNQLAEHLDHIEAHGLSSSQARSLKSAQNEVVPFVAEISAALLQ